MKIKFDRRAFIFLVFALVCLILTSLSPHDYQWVGEVLTVAYIILAFLSWLDNVSHRTFRERK